MKIAYLNIGSTLYALILQIISMDFPKSVHIRS